MATTEHFYSGTGTQTSFPFQFPYLTESDIFVKLYNTETGEFDLLQQNTSGLNHDYSISNTNIVFNTAPPQVAGIDNIHIYRTTDVEIAKAVYGTGSAIRAQDLNNNTNQALFRLQESDQLITTGDIKNGAITEAKLAPNSVTTVHIRNGTIIDEDVSATAAIQGSKIVPNFGVQNIIGDGSQIINPNPNFGNQTITTDLHITAQGNITAAGDLSIDDITASGDMTIDNITAQGDITAARFFGDGSGLTGITFTGIDQFLRRDIDDTASGNITFANNIKIPAASTDQETYPDGQNGSLDGFDKGNIFWNYPENPIGSRAFKSSAWLYLKERNYNYGPTFPSLELHVGEYGSNLGAEFTITTEGQSHCIRFDTNGTNITNYPLRIHNYNGIQWEFRSGSPSFQIHCTSAYGSNPDTYMINSRGTLFIKSGLDIEFTDKGAATNGNNEFFTSTQLKIKSYHDDDDELDLVNGEGYNGGHVELYSNNTKRFETDIFGCVVHSNLRIPQRNMNPTTDWNYDIFNADGYMWDNGTLIFGDKPDRSATTPNTPMDKNNWFYHFYSTGGQDGDRTSTTTFQLGAIASSQVPRGIFEIYGNDQQLVTFSKLEKSGTKFNAPAEIGYSNVWNSDVDEGSSLKFGLHSLYGATKTPSLEIRCKNPDGNPGYRDSYITAGRDSLIIQAGGLNTGLIIEDRASTPNTIAKFISDNSGEATSGDPLYGGAVELYAEGTKRFETNFTGAKVTGVLDVTGNIRIPNDTGKLQLGTSQDLEIFHDGTQSLILDNGTGQLRIGGENTIAITNAAGTESYARFIKDSQVELFYDNVKRFETTSTGVKVSGDFSFCGTSDNEHIRFDAGADHLKFEDNIAAKFGSGSDLQIYHDGSNSFINDQGTGGLKIQSNQTDIVNSSNSEFVAKFIGDDAVWLYYDGSKKFQTTSYGVLATGTIVTTTGNVRCQSDSHKITAGAGNDLTIYHDGAGSKIENSTGSLNINTASSEIWLSKDTSEYLARFITDGAVELYNDGVKKFATTSLGWKSEDDVKGVFGSDGDLQIYHSGSHSFIKHLAAATGNLYIDADGTHDLVLRSGDGSTGRQQAITCFASGGTALYYAGTKHFETTTEGAKTTGSLGVNTAPDSPLHVSGSNAQLITAQRDGTNNAAIEFKNDTSSMYCGLTTNATGFAIDNDANLGAGPNLFVDRSTGNVGINSSSPTEALYVNGNVALPDSDEIQLGTGADLQIFHDATNSIIKNNTGILVIRSDQLRVRNQFGSEDYIMMNADGEVKLTFDGVKKFETTSTGFKVDDDVKGNFGTSSDLQIYHNGNNSFIKHTDGAPGGLYIEADGSNVIIRAGDGGVGRENSIVCRNNAEVELFYSGTHKFETSSTGAKVTGILEAVGTGQTMAGFKVPDYPSDSTADAYGYFSAGDNEDLQIFHDGTNSIIQDNGAGELLFQRGSNTILSLNSAGIEVTDPNGTAVVSVKGFEGGHARLELKADEGDDAGDIWRIQSQSNNNTFILTNNSDGVNTFSTKWRINTDGTVVQKGGLKLPDNQMVMFGGTADNSGDLQIYHDGTNSIIENDTGYLTIKSDQFRLRNGAGNEDYILMDADGAVKLTYDGTNKFETTSSGIKASGSAHVIEGTSSVGLTIATTATSNATNTLEIRGARTSSTTTAVSKIDFTTNDNANTSVYDNTMPMGRISMFKQQGSTNRGRLKIALNNVSGNNLATVFDLESDGDLTINGTLTQSSDRRLKTDIVTISDALNKVNNLRGVEYTKIASGKKEIGVIAQEVQTVFPELVKTGDDEDKTLSVKYGQLTAALIEAVKELTTEVNTLKTKVAALEAA